MDMATKKKQLGRAVERERSKQKLTQRQLAYMADTTQTEISKIENATSDVKVSTLIRISEALGIEVREFFSFWHSRLETIRAVGTYAPTALH